MGRMSRLVPPTYLPSPDPHMASDRRIRETEEHYRVEEGEDGTLALVSQGEKAHRFEISKQHLSFLITGRPGTVSRALEDGKRWITIVIAELEIGTAADMGYSSLLGSNSTWVVRDGRLNHVPLRAVRLEPLSAHREGLEEIRANREAVAILRGEAESPAPEGTAREDEEREEPLGQAQLGHYRGESRWGDGEEEIYLEVGVRDDAFDALFEACLQGQVHEVYTHVEVFALSTGSRYEIARDLLLRPDASIAGEMDQLVARYIPEVRAPSETEREPADDEEDLGWDEEEPAEATAASRTAERARLALAETNRELGRVSASYVSASVAAGLVTLLLGGSLVDAALLGLLGGVFLLVAMVRRLVVALGVQGSVGRGS